jgi:hypothetical protein
VTGTAIFGKDSGSLFDPASPKSIFKFLLSIWFIDPDIDHTADGQQDGDQAD